MHWFQVEIAVLGLMTIGVILAAGMLVWGAVRDFKRAKELDRDNRN